MADGAAANVDGGGNSVKRLPVVGLRTNFRGSKNSQLDLDPKLRPKSRQRYRCRMLCVHVAGVTTLGNWSKIITITL